MELILITISFSLAVIGLIIGEKQRRLLKKQRRLIEKQTEIRKCQKETNMRAMLIMLHFAELKYRPGTKFKCLISDTAQEITDSSKMHIEGTAIIVNDFESVIYGERLGGWAEII